MALPKAFSPSFWLDKIITIFLQLVLAILLYVLYLIKGEQVHITKVKVTVKNGSNSKNNDYEFSTFKNQGYTERSIDDVFNNPTVEIFSNNNNDVNNNNDDNNDNEIITGILTELKPDELDENLIINKISVPVALSNDNDNKFEYEEENNESSNDNDDDNDNDGSEENNESVKSDDDDYYDSDDGSVKEELIHNYHHIVPNFEMKTSHMYNNNNSNIIPFKFYWRHGGNRVYITGDFDNWSACKHEMTRIPNTNDFVAIIDIDRTKQHEFKFIVDGDWRYSCDLETRYDERGIINNFIYAATTSDYLNPNDNVGIFNSHLTAAY